MIKQSITFNSKNWYFAGYIQFLINRSQIHGCVEQKDQMITVFVDDENTQKLEYFSNLLTNYLPHSIFLGEFKVEKSMQKIIPSNLISKNYNIGRCKFCAEENKSCCDHYSNQQPVMQVVQRKDFYENGDIVAIKPSAVAKICNITQSELELLFSIEKPVVKVTIDDQKLISQTGKHFAKVKVYDDAHEIFGDYVFEKDENNIEVIGVKEKVSVIYNNKFPQNLENLHQDALLNRFLNIKKEANFINAIGVNFDTRNISFFNSKKGETKELLRFQRFDAHKTINEIKEKNQKLYRNFEAKFPDVVQKLETAGDIDFFELICMILDLSEFSFDALSDKSCEFRGNGGMKLDAYFDNSGFDYKSFISSIMVFVLADAKKSHIAYSVFESLADMAISVANQLGKKFDSQNFIMMGNMFANNIFYGRILTKFGIQNPFFSRMFALAD